MQPWGRKLAAALLTACMWIGVLGGSQLAASAQAQIAFTPCGESNEFACGHVTVPLDPSGATPGTITLALQRHRASVGEARSAIIALAGGPGQPALPFAEQFAELLGPIAATRDLIVFDQRGIGLSAPLSCHAFERPDLYHSYGALIEACGDQLGPDRAFYTTADTVADIEAIRQAGGYEKLVLYGTSYGTKVAEEYAQEYPEHVEALILDSVVPPNGPDTLEQSTFAAVPRVLSQMCAYRACAGVTADPVADLARVVREMARAPLRGHVFNGEGKAHTVSVTSNDLVGLLLAGDFSTLLRAEFLTSISAAARGDNAPLARLLEAAESGESEAEDFDNPLYYATTCEEQDFPFNRASSPSVRLAEAKAAAKALPASVLGPFTAANALALSDISGCAYWPYTTPAPALDDAPLPNVPTLILSGADDLRTPTANAREVAAEIPDAHLLVVPYTGHSVLSDEPTACAREAMLALFAAKSVKPCSAAPPPESLRPPPLPPLRLSSLSPVSGYGGRPGRTLRAFALTLADFGRQFAFKLAGVASSELTLPTLRVGGLRGGWAEYANGAFSFDDYSYVPGVTLSGTLRLETGDLQIAGASAAHGTLRRNPHGQYVGRLAGRNIQFDPTTASAAIVEDDAAASSISGPGGAAARELAGVLERLLRP
ncbi:MAG TPA: alpha/beta fold hydrolase [Solirubrobacteraceae bacterium]|jgi:pimeloyl-ACP methyl ester carboxylesterase|nr:alpha/beta fold hydrolase [Solirubrobacteraceae bacterium]